MAKSKGNKKKKKPEAKGSGPSKGVLQPALDTFARGDYVTAKGMFEAHRDDPEVSSENKKVASALLESIGIDRGTLMVGFACIGLYLLVILVGYLKQP